ncbi:MAG: aminoacyl-histidine dipeptidase, partial [Bacteroidales bacterium]|nr:aminoacyl-histidine dipeptidase [Bacteroidales bacterium]
YLLDFAKQHNLAAKQDKAGNILITKEATKGKENIPTIILQSHVDMVCEKNANVEHNFDTDPIETIIEGEWLKAKGTTLGADNGIGVAAQLAVLASKDIAHGKIEALFTVDEETGLTGAFALEQDFMTGKILLNLDTEEEGEIYIGCAGGRGTKAFFKYKPKETPKKHFWFKVAVKGLKGGHSGSDIDHGLGNANKILSRFLYQLIDKKYKLMLSEIDGGNLHNAIAREAYAVAGVKSKHKETVRVKLNHLLADIQDELKHTDANVDITLESTDTPKEVIGAKKVKRLIRALTACPHGVIEMSRDIPGVVETSTNLASIKMREDNSIEIGTSQRSLTESSKENIVNTVTSVFKLAKAKVINNDGYPGWAPNPESLVLKVAKDEYKSLYDKTPEVKVIHAGLECGLFLQKYPELDMISIGPTIRNAHSPDEKTEIASVPKWWDFFVKLLENMPEKK